MKKILATLLITVMMLGNLAVLTVPNRAQAFLGFGDISFDPPTTIPVVKDLLIKIGEAALKRLANKVLNKMVKKTVNWALTGFGPYEESAGQPFYVQNQDSLMKNIEDQQLVKTIQELGDGCENGECPYAKDLARSLVKSNINGGKSEAKFDLDKYSSNWQAFTEEGKFSEGGGWKTWEGMFNNPQNSAFGAFLTTTIKTETKKQEATTAQEKELTRNDGFLSMRKCTAYANGKEPTSEIDFSKFKSNSKTDIKSGEIKDPSDTYDPGTIYSSGDTVFYNSNQYQYIGEPDSGHAPVGNPLSQKYWQNITTGGGSTPKEITEEYKSAKQYTAGNRVSYSLSIFEALKDAKGNPPPLTSTNNAYWKFIEKSSTGQTIGNVTDYFDDTYALPGLEVDNCIRYEVTTPGAMAKEMLGKTLTTSIDKATLDSTTGNSIVDSLVDMAAVFITNGLDKMITKATTKTGDQQLFAGGIGDPNATYLGAGNGANTNSPYYSEDGKNPVEIQDPYDETKLHPTLLAEMELTKQEIELLHSETTKDGLVDVLRSMPIQYMVLDQCLPGPDLGWEQRMKDEFNRSKTRLDKKAGNDNNKGEKAQQAINELERYRDREISNTKLSMLSVIPSAIPIMSKMSEIKNTTSELTSNEKKYTQRVGALATIESIQQALAAGGLDNASLVALKKQYSGIKRNVSTEESIDDTLQDREAALSDINVSFNAKNKNSLMSKCVEQRKALSDYTIGADLGHSLFCSWQLPSTISHRDTSTGHQLLTKVGATSLLVVVAPFLAPLGNLAHDDEVVDEKARFDTSPFDPDRFVQYLYGDSYTQGLSPFDEKGDNALFKVDCDNYYRASMSYYEDLK